MTAGYWDTDTSGHVAGEAGQGQSTAALQSPTDYAGLYAEWNVDVDGDGSVDAPWHFGTDAQYPALSFDMDGDGQATWQEAGRQLRSGPAVTAQPAAEPTQVVLTWAPVDGTAWTPSPAVTYTVYRESGGALETVAAGVRDAEYTDRGVEPGGGYRYPGGGGGRRRRVVTQQPGGGRGAVLVHGDARVPGRAVAGWHG